MELKEQTQTEYKDFTVRQRVYDSGDIFTDFWSDEPNIIFSAMYHKDFNQLFIRRDIKDKPLILDVYETISNDIYDCYHISFSAFDSNIFRVFDVDEYDNSECYGFERIFQFNDLKTKETIFLCCVDDRYYNITMPSQPDVFSLEVYS